MQGDRDERDAFAERLFRSALGYFDLLSIRLGQRLGLYEVLAEGPVTSQELASRAGIAERYAREWLEQQATVGILRADVETEDPTFSLPPGHAEVLLDGDSLSYMGASIWQLLTIPNAFEKVIEAFRTGGGVSHEAYGRDSVQGQGLGNRPVFLATLPNDWLPNIPPMHERLTAQPSARAVDVGCGTGWSSIAMAKAYPQITVDGFDPYDVSIELARKNAEVEGVAERVRFHRADAADVTTAGPFDVATAFECVHDMARPVEVLGAVRRALADDGSMLIVDERTREGFTGEPDELEAYFYGWSIFDCLPTGMYEQPSAGTGTVMRPSVLEGYAREAGFTRFQALPIEHDTFRLYLLRP
jgi:2-polyprenyl-3-methyl-5-hydroxy-6-metoxy-1,4-benzoquinol methylase